MSRGPNVELDGDAEHLCLVLGLLLEEEEQWRLASFIELKSLC